MHMPFHMHKPPVRGSDVPSSMCPFFIDIQRKSIFGPKKGPNNYALPRPAKRLLLCTSLLHLQIYLGVIYLGLIGWQNPSAGRTGPSGRPPVRDGGRELRSGRLRPQLRPPRRPYGPCRPARCPPTPTIREPNDSEVGVVHYGVYLFSYRGEWGGTRLLVKIG